MCCWAYEILDPEAAWQGRAYKLAVALAEPGPFLAATRQHIYAFPRPLERQFALSLIDYYFAMNVGGSYRHSKPILRSAELLG